ncbi:hypothetical protein SUGI_0941680 [Cryptomeria japonica]|nr:hypothetical protein SUGI_0941680 [Cryptomeria japonica]
MHGGAIPPELEYLDIAGANLSGVLPQERSRLIQKPSWPSGFVWRTFISASKGCNQEISAKYEGYLFNELLGFVEKNDEKIIDLFNELPLYNVDDEENIPILTLTSNLEHQGDKKELDERLAYEAEKDELAYEAENDDTLLQEVVAQVKKATK